ncbi:hypothetical protein GW17_00062444 [Ensete ventricosum]|nr:hypothetical protein GW17_00062444 [Ensete ventricosum]
MVRRGVLTICRKRAEEPPKTPGVNSPKIPGRTNRYTSVTIEIHGVLTGTPRIAILYRLAMLVFGRSGMNWCKTHGSPFRSVPHDMGCTSLLGYWYADSPLSGDIVSPRAGTRRCLVSRMGMRHLLAFQHEKEALPHLPVRGRPNHYQRRSG